MNSISRNTTTQNTLITLNTWERLLAALCLTGMLVIVSNFAEIEMQPGWFDFWLTQAMAHGSFPRG
ncbi:hypothetical protein [Trichothermofontia sp.]